MAESYLKGHMERQHVRSVLQMREVEMGGGGSYLHVFLPLGAKNGNIPGDRMSVIIAYHWPAEGTFHVQTRFLRDSGGA